MNVSIKIERIIYNDIPLLLCYKDNKEEMIPIILLHQLLEDKESELTLAYYLAVSGYYVMIPDLLYHGEWTESVRNSEKLDFNKLFTEMDRSMELIQNLIQYVHMFSGLSVNSEKIGIVGTSYGGMLALAAGSQFHDIKFVAALCTSANWSTLVENYSFEAFRIFSKKKPVVEPEVVSEYILKYDPIYHIEGFEDKPVLLISGVLDTTFTYELLKPFYEKMTEHYIEKKCPEKFEWKRYRRAGHKVIYDMVSYLKLWLKKL